MSEKNKALLAQLLFLTIGTGMYLYTEASNFQVIYKNDIASGSGGVPRVVCGAIIILSLIKIVLILLDKKISKEKRKNEEESLVKGLLSIGLLFAYVALIRTIGFPLLTPFYLFFTMWLFAPQEKRNLKFFALFSLIATVIIFGVFYYMLKVMLPVGIIRSLL